MEPCAYKTMSVMAIFQPLGILREISLSENSLFWGHNLGAYKVFFNLTTWWEQRGIGRIFKNMKGFEAFL